MPPIYADQAISIAQVGAIMKKVILPRIQKNVFTKTVLLDKIEKNKGTKFTNNEIYITADSSMHNAFTWNGATGAIPMGASTQQQMKALAKYATGGSVILDQTLQATKGEGAIVEYSSKLQKDLQETARRALNRSMFRNGQGVLATLTAGTAAGTVVTVDTTRFISVGQKLAIGTKAEIEAGTADLVTVASVNSKVSFTVTATVTLANADRVVNQDVYDTTTSSYKEMDGLDGLLSDNTESSGIAFQTLSRATNDWVNTYVDTSAAQLTEAMIIDAVTNAAEFGNPQFIMTTPALRNRYAAILQGTKQTVNTVDYSGGYRGLEVSAGAQPVVLMSDYDCPTGSLFVIDPEAFSLSQLAPLGFIEDASGGILSNVYNGDGNRIPAYQFAMRFYGNLVCFNPRASTKLKNKTA